MSIVITDASPQAMAEQPANEIAKAIYPFDQLEPGKCFTIPKAEANVRSLRTIASRKSKDGKKFVVVEHGEPHNCVEVARKA